MEDYTFKVGDVVKIKDNAIKNENLRDVKLKIVEIPMYSDCVRVEVLEGFYAKYSVNLYIQEIEPYEITLKMSDFELSKCEKYKQKGMCGKYCEMLQEGKCNEKQ